MCNGLANKKLLIKDILIDYSADVLFIQESELEEHMIQSVKIPGFDVCVESSSLTSKTRSLAYIRNDIKYESITQCCHFLT